MKCSIGIFVWLGVLLAFPVAGEETKAPLPLPTLSETEAFHFHMLVNGNNRFGFDLYHHLKQQNGNFFFSPYSIATGLGMVAIGAKGETQLQFQQAFRYSLPLLLFVGDLNQSLQKGEGNNEKDAGKIVLANDLWIERKVQVLPSYIQTLKRNFRAALQVENFTGQLSQPLQVINRMTATQTDGKIQNIISNQEVRLGAQLILTTAASVLGRWAYPFDRKDSKRMPFYSTSQRPIQSEMMQRTAKLPLSQGKEWDILSIPFVQGVEGGQLTMTLLLPKAGVAIKELEKKLTWENWETWKNETTLQLVALTLPTFRIDKRIELESLLKSVRITKVFSSEADLSGLTENKGVYLDAAVHKVSIRVDEGGAGVPLRREAAQPPLELGAEEKPYPFTANRPFILIIWDQKTESILFMGRVVLP